MGIAGPGHFRSYCNWGLSYIPGISPKGELAGHWEVPKAMGRGKDLLSETMVAQILKQQKKSRPFKAQVSVLVVSEKDRKIVRIEP